MQRDIRLGPEKDAPGVFGWAGYSFPCSVSGLKRRQQLDTGGYQADVDFSIRIRQDAKTSAGVLFSAVVQPTYGKACTVDGTTYGIRGVDNALGAWLKLDLKDPNQP